MTVEHRRAYRSNDIALSRKHNLQHKRRDILRDGVVVVSRATIAHQLVT
jgi:hypothetical protein